MASFKTTPVYFCKRCGRPLRVTAAESFNDPAGEQLAMVAKVLGEVALCGPCRKRRNWYSQQGRLADWEAGRA